MIKFCHFGFYGRQPHQGWWIAVRNFPNIGVQIFLDFLLFEIFYLISTEFSELLKFFIFVLYNKHKLCIWNRIEELISELPAEQRTAILKLIDLKTEQDMKEVINSIKHLENKMDTQIKLLFWALGIIITLIIALKIFG